MNPETPSFPPATPRNASLDIAKGIGILAVAFSHNWIVDHEEGEWHQILFSFHLPLFFFLSGIFIQESQAMKTFALSRADALLKPYLTVLLLFCPLILWQGPASLAGYLGGMLYATGETIAVVPLWFLPHLFASLLFVKGLLPLLKDRHPRWLLTTALLLLAGGVHFIDFFWRRDLSAWPGFASFPETKLPGLPFSLDLLGISSAYLLFGYHFRQASRNFTPRILPVLAAFLGYCLLHYTFHETIDLNYRIYNSLLIDSLQAFLGIYLVMAFSAWIAGQAIFGPFLAYLGSASLFILAFHYIPQQMAFPLLAGYSDSNELIGMESFVIGIVASILAYELSRRAAWVGVFLLPMCKSGEKR
ncbi:MAG: acyltransferase family protein [Magnetococcales bacterium]|nr:acyltransferase family protein [Magnetococcales bacterium]